LLRGEGNCGEQDGPKYQDKAETTLSILRTS